MREMKLIPGLLMVVLCVVFAAGTSFAQTPKAVIKIQGYSPQELVNLNMTTPRSTGLATVGVGQLVYLVGSDSAGAAVTSFAWTLAAKPAGSAAVLDSTATKQITFTPDLEGKFDVELVVTTAGGASAPKTVTITSAKFVGVGSMDGLSWTFPQCALCHQTNFDRWKDTGHATMFSRGIDGIASDHYAERCISCHTTGYDASPSAINDGFDDVQSELGWIFPTALHAGNWDTLKTDFTKLAHRANIQCESCHGPGSLHKGDKTSIDMSLDASVCAYCHESGSRYIKPTQWKESLHAVGVASAASRAGCSDCHSGWGAVRRLSPMANDKRPSLGVPETSCAVCHEPHSAEEEYQLRGQGDVTLADNTVVNYGGASKLCMQCHHARREAESYSSDPANISSYFGPHGSCQADMLNGTNGIEYGLPIGSSGHKFAAAEACVTCHMATTPAAGSPGSNKVGEHTFAVKWDGGTPDDPSDDVENVAVCQNCHGPINSFEEIMAKADWDEDGTIEATMAEVEGLLEKLGNLLPPAGPSVAISKADYDWTGKTPEEAARRKALLKAAFNYQFVEEDGSKGVHNATYAITLLRRSIASLTTGDVGAAEIISITDVPNDQGKQVRVAWTKFPGDGISANPIQNYALWRRVDESFGTTAIPVPTKAAMVAQVTASDVGKRFVTEQEGQWDFLALIPAVGHEVYSMVAPTLYDSTSVGVYWSVFYVSGQAAGATFETAPDSGYSIDNLVPAAPQNVTAFSSRNNVTLRWDEPTDADFRYFAVYRSNTSGFDPKGTAPVITLSGTEFTDLDLATGSTLYYRVSAFDFSGNESEYSPEVAVVVTSVVQQVSAIPTEYALNQNYPNPFNPQTTIKYQLPQLAHVRLSVYTVLGSEVRRLVDRTQEAAYHTVIWDGLDDQGNQMPSGVYVYRLESNGFTAIKKMTLMK